MTKQKQRPSILIIGIGNTVRGDDAIGVHALRHIERSLSAELRRIVATREHQTAFADLLELFEPNARVIILDSCVQDGAPVGSIRRTRGIDLVQRAAYAMHQVGLPRVLALARDLELIDPSRVVVFSVAVPNADEFSERFSFSVEQTVQMVTGAVMLEIERIAQSILGEAAEHGGRKNDVDRFEMSAAGA